MVGDMRRSRFLPTALAVAVTIAAALAGVACGSDDDTSSAGPTTVTGRETTSSSAETTTSSATTAPTNPESVMMAGESIPTARLLLVANGLCEALAQAPADVAAAKRTFNGKSHDGLHLIARGLEAVDRVAAATLLEAKQKVEADFSRSAAGPQVAADLRTLADVTRSSLAHFNVSADACPSS